MGTDNMAAFRAICKRAAVKEAVEKLEQEKAELEERYAATDKYYEQGLIKAVWKQKVERLNEYNRWLMWGDLPNYKG